MDFIAEKIDTVVFDGCTFEVRGKTYVAVSAGCNDCHGCAFWENLELCVLSPDCWVEDIVDGPCFSYEEVKTEGQQ